MQGEVIIGRKDVERLYADVEKLQQGHGEASLEPLLWAICYDVRKIRLILERTNNVRVDHG